MNKHSSHMIIALVLIIVITIVVASSAYFWIVNIQGEIQAGTQQSQAKLSKDVTGSLEMVIFQYDINTENANVVLENSGSRNVKNIGSINDKLVISSGESSCDIGFNSSTCDTCPFNLDVDESREINIDFAGSDCEMFVETEYTIYLALADNQLESSFIPTEDHNLWLLKSPDDKPSSRAFVAISAVTGTDKILLFGGYDPNTNPINETWVYDYSDRSWTQISTIGSPSVRFGATMTQINRTDLVLLFGGHSNNSNCDNSGSNYCNGTWIYNVSNSTWTRISTTNYPSARRLHAMSFVDDTNKAVLFGGDTESGNSANDTWIYNHSDYNWYNVTSNYTSGPSGREEHAMASIDGTDKVLLFGGDPVGASRDDETWVYDLSDNNWAKMSPIGTPTARFQHVIASLHGTNKIVLFGGDDSDSNGETWIYEYSTDTWSRQYISPSPFSRVGPGLASIYGTNKILLFGGWDGGDYHNDTWIYVD